MRTGYRIARPRPQGTISRRMRLPRPDPELLRDRRRHAAFLGIAAAVVVLDQVAKAIVRELLDVGEREWLAEFFAFSHVLNDGGAFGFFSGGNAWLTVASLAAMGVVVLFHLFPPADLRLVRWGLGLIMGGAVGNLLDRLYQGSVTDFIDFIHFPAFNVADAAINVGVAALVIALIFGDLRRRPAEGR